MSKYDVPLEVYETGDDRVVTYRTNAPPQTFHGERNGKSVRVLRREPNGMVFVEGEDGVRFHAFPENLREPGEVI